jgi:hypothetical protein
MRTILHGWNKGTIAPISSNDNNSNSSSGSSIIEFLDIPPLFEDSPPLGQPDDISILSLPSSCSRPPSPLLPPSSPHPSDVSTDSTLSAASSVSLLADDIVSLDATLAVPIPRGRPNASRLNDAWQTFFRDALVPPVPSQPVPAGHFTPYQFLLHSNRQRIKPSVTPSHRVQTILSASGL